MRILGGGGWQWRALSRAVDDRWDAAALNENDSSRWQPRWRQTLFHSVSVSVVLQYQAASDQTSVWEPGPHSYQLPAKETAPEMWSTSSQASAKPWFLHPRQWAWNKRLFLMDSCDWEPKAWGGSVCAMVWSWTSTTRSQESWFHNKTLILWLHWVWFGSLIKWWSKSPFSLSLV